MGEPRIHVRGKGAGTNKSQESKHKDTQNWAGREQPPPPSEQIKMVEQEKKAHDYWSPYLKKRVPKKPKKIKRKHHTFASAKKAGTQHQDTNHSLLKLIVSGGSAVLVGTLMGLLILKVFVSGGAPEDSNSIDIHLEDPAKSADTEQQGTGKAASEAVVLPEMKTVWVQGGVYSNKEGADGLAEAQRDRGQAAVVKQMGGQYRVFFGVGLTRDAALTIASEIKDSGGDVYLKDDLSIAAASLDGLPNEQGQKLKQLATSGQNILSVLGSLSAAGIGGENIQEAWANEMEKVEKSHRSFLSAVSGVKDALTDGRQQVVNEMDQALAQAVEAAKQYNKEASTPYLWQVQEGIMQYLIAYQQLGSSN